MQKARLKRWARQFPENGMKFLLEHPLNVRELFAIRGQEFTTDIDFHHMQRVRGSFVLRDYRHVEADLVLSAPLLFPGASRRRVLLYLLLEHQSKLDDFMVFRALDYVVQIYRSQLRGKKSLAGFRFQPVLPFVFYTGKAPWNTLKPMAELIEAGDLFRAVTPSLTPAFLSLRTVPAQRLVTSGGYLGQVLRLVQAKDRGITAFEALLEEVVSHLEPLAPAEQLRWQEFLSYIHALVYYERGKQEHEHLYDVIESSLQSVTRKREVRTMGQTMAEYLQAKGRREGRREGQQKEAIRSRQASLLLFLKSRFGNLPAGLEDAIRQCDDVAQLNTWISQAATAAALKDTGIDYC